MRARIIAAALTPAIVLVLAAAGDASAAWNVSWGTTPTMGNLSGVTLNAQAQTTTTTWNLGTSPFAVTSNGFPNGGWNITVIGDSSAGQSAVFKQYCPNATCGTDSGPGYIAGGYTLPANSLKIDTTSSGWTTAGTKPAYQCTASACNVDSAAAVKIVSASTSVASGTWTTNGTASLSLSTPSTLRKLQTSEVYRVDLVWTLSTGP